MAHGARIVGAARSLRSTCSTTTHRSSGRPIHLRGDEQTDRSRKLCSPSNYARPPFSRVLSKRSDNLSVCLQKSRLSRVSSSTTVRCWSTLNHRANFPGHSRSLEDVAEHDALMSHGNG